MANSLLSKTKFELRKGLSRAKCRKCGCMKGVLETLKSAISSVKTKSASSLLKAINSNLLGVQKVEYECFSCEYCFAAEALSAFNQDVKKYGLTRGSYTTVVLKD